MSAVILFCDLCHTFSRSVNKPAKRCDCASDVAVMRMIQFKMTRHSRIISETIRATLELTLVAWHPGTVADKNYRKLAPVTDTGFCAQFGAAAGRPSIVLPSQLTKHPGLGVMSMRMGWPPICDKRLS